MAATPENPLDSDLVKCSVCGRMLSLCMAWDEDGHMVEVERCLHCPPSDEEKLEAWRQSCRRRWRLLCPEEYRALDVEKMPPAMIEKWTALKLWQPDGKGLLFHGHTSLGKTRIAYAILQRQLWFGKSVFAIDAVTLGEAITAKWTDHTAHQLLSDPTRHDVVLIDDLGKAPFTERVTSEIFGLLERRLSWRRSTIVTTNEDGATLREKIIARSGDEATADALLTRLRRLTSISFIKTR